LTVYLVDMVRNCTRACRVAWSLGVGRVVLVGDTPAPERWHLYSARGLEILRAADFPADVLVLEVNGRTRVEDVNWGGISGVAVGGPAVQFGRRILARNPSARIVSRQPCLTGDQALAVALYARRLRCC